MFGNFTRYPSNIRDRPSVIDYSICSVDLMEQIHSFSVLPYTGLSDHCCLSASIKGNIETDKNTEPDFADKNTIHTNVAKFTYDKNLKDIFEKHILQDENLKRLESSLANNKLYSQETIDGNIKDINQIILHAAKKTFYMRRSKKGEKWKTKKRGRGGLTQDVRLTGTNLD